MIRKRDLDHIETARKYGLQPGKMKCEAYALFDNGYSAMEVRHILRRYQHPRFKKRFANTIKKYHQLWKKAQGEV